MADLREALSLISDLTLTTAFALGLYAFYSGKVFSRNGIQQVINGILKNMYEEVRGAVKDGMMEAFYEMNDAGKQSKGSQDS